MFVPIRASSQKLVSSEIFPFPHLPHQSISKSCSFYCTPFSIIIPLIQAIFRYCLNDYNNLLIGHQASLLRSLEPISCPLSISIFISKSIIIQYLLFFSNTMLQSVFPLLLNTFAWLLPKSFLYLLFFSPGMLCLHSGYTGSFFYHLCPNFNGSPERSVLADGSKVALAHPSLLRKEKQTFVLFRTQNTKHFFVLKALPNL